MTITLKTKSPSDDLQERLDNVKQKLTEWKESPNGFYTRLSVHNAWFSLSCGLLATKLSTQKDSQLQELCHAMFDAFLSDPHHQGELSWFMTVFVDVLERHGGWRAWRDDKLPTAGPMALRASHVLALSLLHARKPTGPGPMAGISDNLTDAASSLVRQWRDEAHSRFPIVQTTKQMWSHIVAWAGHARIAETMKLDEAAETLFGPAFLALSEDIAEGNPVLFAQQLANQPPPFAWVSSVNTKAVASTLPSDLTLT